jgi:pantetheine-phosphate adenylyltransferase
MKACYPGTFDPLTNGHMDIIERAAKIADELIVAIMVNPDKKVLFSVLERIEMIKESVSHLPNVSVVAAEGLTVDLCRKLGASVLIRGIRAVMDYEYELQQSTANMMLDDTIESIFLVATPELSFISSSVVKNLVLSGGDAEKFVPTSVNRILREKIHGNRSSF